MWLHIQLRRLQWVGHVHRMEKQRISQRTMEEIIRKYSVWNSIALITFT